MFSCRSSWACQWELVVQSKHFLGHTGASEHIVDVAAETDLGVEADVPEHVGLKLGDVEASSLEQRLNSIFY